MISQSTLTFLRDIKKNNNREWFLENHARYLAAKDDFESVVDKLIKELAKVNPPLARLKVKDCVFRIYRDVRFSKNKTPYKTNFGAYFAEGGKKSVKAGFYIQLEPGASFAAGGSWMPEAAELKKIRQEIDYNHDDLIKLLKKPSFKKMFELADYKIKTSPKGYDISNPAIDHLRQTSFVASTALTIC
jgi:uncharacterized protein (TIGR02453 family)